MSLPSHTSDKAAFLALDPKCASPTSSDSKRTVAQLAEQTAAYKDQFIYAATFWDLGNLVRCALEAKISPDTKTDYEGTPMLVAAAQHDSIHALKALLRGGANIELPDKAGSSALICASREGHLACLQILIEAGANSNVQDWLGSTPLMDAVRGKHVECARALLPLSYLYRTNGMGRMALHCAIFCASEECFKLLLERVSDVDSLRTVPGKSPQGQVEPCHNETALNIACAMGQQPMCKALLTRGASRMSRDNLQRIPLHWAAREGNLSCVLVLIGRPGKALMTPAEVDAVDEHGHTALHLAACGGFEKACGVLLQAGARLDAKTEDGFTPLMCAQQEHPTHAALLALLSGQGPSSQPLPGTVCDHCGKTAEQASVKLLKVCGNCHGVRFCNAACQTAAWPGHKKACRARVAEREERTRVTMVPPPASRPAES